MLYNPVVHAYAIVTRDSAFYYVNKAKVDLKVRCMFLHKSAFRVCNYLGSFL